MATLTDARDAVLLDGRARRRLRAGGRLPRQLHRLPRPHQRRPDRHRQVGAREPGSQFNSMEIIRVIFLGGLFGQFWPFLLYVGR